MSLIDWEKRRRVMERSQALGHCICDPRRPCPCDVFRSDGLCPCAGERPEPVELAEVKLTRTVRNAGCASKIAPADLEAVLSRLPEVKDPDVISGLAAADDAAIYRLSDNVHLVQTVDVFTPCVDDPHTFGRICASNCLSDIYAMGGVPRTALSILCFPSETLSGEIMFQMLAGAMEVLSAAGVALIGGHSVKDDEIKLGFAITGTIDPHTAARLDHPHAGDLLVLTKPLGTGVLAFAHQIGRSDPSGWLAAVESMSASNQTAAEAMIRAGASACTDITGFGLFGHLLRLVRRADLGAEIDVMQLPLFPGALEAVRAGMITGAMERNREFAEGDLAVAEGVDEARLYLGFDAQTSGGLLIAVPQVNLEKLRLALAAHHIPACCIGQLAGARRPRLEIVSGSRSLTPHSNHDTSVKAMTSPHIHHPSASAPCCCPGPSIDSVTALPGANASATATAFGEFMRQVRSAGAVSEKTKELILFSLVVQSRCAPCFDAHYRKALDLGLNPAELDEAAWCAVALGGAQVRLFYLESLRRVQSKKEPA
jgi:selenide, water dikinase